MLFLLPRYFPTMPSRSSLVSVLLLGRAPAHPVSALCSVQLLDSHPKLTARSFPVYLLTKLQAVQRPCQVLVNISNGTKAESKGSFQRQCMKQLQWFWSQQGPLTSSHTCGQTPLKVLPFPEAILPLAGWGSLGGSAQSLFPAGL